MSVKLIRLAQSVSAADCFAPQFADTLVESAGAQENVEHVSPPLIFLSQTLIQFLTAL